MSYPRLLLTALLLATALAGPAQAQRATAAKEPGRLFLWKATSKTNTVYLLGSIHVANEAFYPLPAEVEKAFADSKVLAVEVDLTKVDAAGVQGALLQKGMYPGAETIGKHVPKETLERMREYFSNRGMIPDAMEKFRPWALAVTITMLEVQSHGYESALGIDKYFTDRAGSRKVVELESADEQVNLLSSFSAKQEAEFLAATLDSAAETKDLMDRMVALWKAGDAEGLEKLTIEEPLRERPDLRGVYAKMFDERNEKMAKKVDGFLKGDQPHFVVVGAGHLIGPKGVVKLLEKKGYHLEQVKKSEKVEAAAAKDKPAGDKKPPKRGYAPAGAFKD